MTAETVSASEAWSAKIGEARSTSERSTDALLRAQERIAARYREFVLRGGERVAVFGRAVREPEPTVLPAGLRQPAFRVVLGEPPEGVIVSNEPGFSS